MKKYFPVFFLALTAVFFLSCTGPAGTDGIPGAPGGYYTDFQSGVYPAGSGFAGTEDAILYMPNPDNNYGGALNSSLGVIDAFGNSVCRVVMRFDISGYFIPQNVIVRKAYLTLTGNGGVFGNGVTATAHALNTAFVEMETTWNSSSTGNLWLNPYYGAAVSAAPVWIDPGIDAKSTMELNAATVQGWITDPSSNYGIVLKAVDEVNMNATSVNLSNHGTASTRPMLRVYYTLP